MDGLFEGYCYGLSNAKRSFAGDYSKGVGIFMRGDGNTFNMGRL